jgi:hypothetical protein
MARGQVWSKVLDSLWKKLFVNWLSRNPEWGLNSER